MLEKTSLISDVNYLKDFYNNIYEDLRLNEVHFISLAARNKYLDEDERFSHKLGKTQMLYKTVLKRYDFIKFLSKVEQIDASADYYLTLNNTYIPKKCCVIYANINPSDTIKATADFKKILAEYDAELFNISLNTEDKSRFENAMLRYNNLHNNLMTCYQNNRSRKLWSDIDIDCEDNIKEEDLQQFIKDLNINAEDAKIILVRTHGGFHFLMRTRDMDREYNPGIVQEKLAQKFGDICKEIVINKNEMIPIPGTFQALFPVTMSIYNKNGEIRKEDSCLYE